MTINPATIISLPLIGTSRITIDTISRLLMFAANNVFLKVALHLATFSRRLTDLKLGIGTCFQ